MERRCDAWPVHGPPYSRSEGVSFHTGSCANDPARVATGRIMGPCPTFLLPRHPRLRARVGVSAGRRSPSDPLPGTSSSTRAQDRVTPARPSPGFRGGDGGSSVSSRSARCSSRVCGRATTAPTSTYTEFIAEVEDGNVEEIEVNKGSGKITGELTNGDTFNTTAGGEAGLFEGDQEFLEENGVDRSPTRRRATTSCSTCSASCCRSS